MVTTRGSGSGVDGSKGPMLSKYEMREMITTQVTMQVREAIPKMVGFLETAMIELFDEFYVSVTKVVATITTTAIAATKL